MPRHQHHQKASAPGASQRQLRVGELIRHAAVISLLSLFPVNPSLAEVCDKVVKDDWNSKSGPAWLLNPATAPLPEHFVIIAALGALVVFRARWASFVGAALLLLTAASLWIGWFDGDGIFDTSLREGCLSVGTLSADTFILSVLAVVCLWSGRILWQQRKVK